MGFGKFLGGVVKQFKSQSMQLIGPVIAESFLPGIMPVIQFVINAALIAEDKFGAKTGPEKLADVMLQATVGAPLIARMIEQSTGKNLVDEDKMQSGLKSIASGAVDLMNAFGLLPKS